MSSIIKEKSLSREFWQWDSGEEPLGGIHMIQDSLETGACVCVFGGAGNEKALQWWG